MWCFFLQTIRSINESFPALFDTRTNEQGDNGNTSGERPDRFTERFGWFSTCEQVAEYKRIELDEVWDLHVIDFLNSLVYLKEKKKYVDALNRKSTGIR